MKEDKITALYVKVHKAPEEISLDNTLKAFQKAVGGYIEFYPLDNGKASIILDEEGKLKGYEGNRKVENEIIAGDFLIVGDDGKGGCISLTREQLNHYMARFKEPEIFTKDQVEENIMIEVMTPEEFQDFIDPRPTPFPKPYKANDKSR